MEEVVPQIKKSLKITKLQLNEGGGGEEKAKNTEREHFKMDNQRKSERNYLTCKSWFYCSLLAGFLSAFPKCLRSINWIKAVLIRTGLLQWKALLNMYVFTSEQPLKGQLELQKAPNNRGSKNNAENRWDCENQINVASSL